MMNNFVLYKAGATKDPSLADVKWRLSLAVVGTIVPDLVGEVATKEAPHLV